MFTSIFILRTYYGYLGFPHDNSARVDAWKEKMTFTVLSNILDYLIIYFFKESKAAQFASFCSFDFNPIFLYYDAHVWKLNNDCDKNV